MGRAVDSELMIGMHELSCGMMDMDAACESEDLALAFMAPGCCDNEFLSIEIEDDYKLVSETFSFETQFLFAFTYTTIFDSQDNHEPFVAHVDHPPPLLGQDYQSLYQSFLL